MSRAAKFEAFLRRQQKFAKFRRRQKRREQREREGNMVNVNDRTRAFLTKHSEPTVAPPHANWLLVTKRQFNANGKTFPCGSTISVAECGDNFQQLLDCHFIAWMPPTDRQRPLPRDLPKPAPARAKPTIEIIDDPDIVM